MVCQMSLTDRVGASHARGVALAHEQIRASANHGDHAIIGLLGHLWNSGACEWGLATFGFL